MHLLIFDNVPDMKMYVKYPTSSPLLSFKSESIFCLETAMLIEKKTVCRQISVGST